MTSAESSGAHAPDDHHVLLPGRYRYAFDQVTAHWAFNDRRQELLDGLCRFVDELRSVVLVCAVWLSGSYFTSKKLPADIDTTVVVPAEELDELTGNDRLLFTPAGLRGLAGRINVRVDAYILPWHCLPRPDPNDPDHRRYLVGRGYWDDWWMRLRSSTPAEGALPRRGYVEVIVDGYTA